MNRTGNKQHPSLTPVPIFTLVFFPCSSRKWTLCSTYCRLIHLLSRQFILIPFRICINSVQFSRSNAFCQPLKQAHISSSMSTVSFDIILRIPIASLVPLPLLIQNCHLEILPADIRMEEKLSSRLLCLQSKHLAFVCIFGKGLSRESNNVVAFPFAFHLAVQQTFKPLWSCLLLQGHEPSWQSFTVCFKLLLIFLLPASEEFLSEVPSPRHLSSRVSYPLDISGLGDPPGSNITAVLVPGFL